MTKRLNEKEHLQTACIRLPLQQTELHVGVTIREEHSKKSCYTQVLKGCSHLCCDENIHYICSNH